MVRQAHARRAHESALSRSAQAHGRARSVGVGKTFIAQALGHIACRHGYHVRFTRADEMLRRLRQSRLDNSRDAEMIALTSVDLLVLDDFALEPMSKEESKDVYQLFLERTGRASMIVTSNRDTAEWLAMFDDVLLAQSAVDRFKNAAYDFVIEGESYRRRLKPKLDEANPPPASPAKTPASTRALGHAAGADPGASAGSRRLRGGGMPLQKSGAASTANASNAIVDTAPDSGHSRSRSFSPSLWRHHPAKQVAAWGANWQSANCGTIWRGDWSRNRSLVKTSSTRRRCSIVRAFGGVVLGPARPSSGGPRQPPPLELRRHPCVRRRFVPTVAQHARAFPSCAAAVRNRRSRGNARTPVFCAEVSLSSGRAGRHAGCSSASACD
ncbi:MAG TPA: ATP-binding protein [Polyangiaceae bacterium]|nr:ATP-binding protein [Polyangiaceae bacterium]